MELQPYLFFNGRCEEAIGFYRQAIDAQLLMMMRMGESPDQGEGCPGDPNAIMHATIKIGPDMLMMSDGMTREPARFSGFSLSISADNEVDCQRYFAALSEGGSVTLPVQKTFWSPAFGMCTDRFGVAWMVSIAGGQA